METLVSRKYHRNESLECLKLIASFFVVFIHVKFPEPAGSLATALARFAVPLFFAVSGYFSFGTPPGKLAKRLIHVGKLYLLAGFLGAVLGWAVTIYYWGDPVQYWRDWIPTGEDLIQALLVQKSFFRGTGFAWYLLSLMLCYGLLCLYCGCFRKRKVSYRPLYIVCTLLLLCHLLLGEVLPVLGIRVDYMRYRNGWLMGMPMFAMGLFLREWGDVLRQKLCLTDRALLGLAAAGLGLTVAQWCLTGTGELPPGAVLQSAALLLLTAGHPSIKESAPVWKTAAGLCGSLSTGVYLLHCLLQEAYTVFLLPRISGGTLEEWLRPLLIIALSVAVGLTWILGEKLLRLLWRKARK